MAASQVATEGCLTPPPDPRSNAERSPRGVMPPGLALPPLRALQAP